ncbi:MAG: aminotransferase class IV [Chitinophagaceae bacterium]|jgi:branched-chain amino acid aminotransferase|nr:aminotransferase class IV [Chitinophagaceae bacterium]MBK9660251.1 aminotransferase class IV [Chitinophagaceae bacterium]MBK9939688.1 aminotransferase class IV [Chitinophagaceae bacterium]MBL0070099.1 aminotransferase class IV [Chitinophagaceae bacterium]MBP6417404.1 aminotransferase class IV [Chitinophagaceae bacterium]
MNSICFNGKFFSADEPVLLASNRGYRYGDGLFETMKVQQGNILLADYHFERLFTGIAMLQFEMPRLFLRQRTEDEILHLCKKNKCEQLGRVRLSVFRGNGGLYDEEKALQYLIECWPLNESVSKLNENGLVIDIYSEAEKSCDKFSNLKSANFLPYSMAALYAKEKKVNDCLVLNSTGSIADSTIANLFVIKNGIIVTPGLDEACVNGVMRRHLLKEIQNAGYDTREVTVSVNDLANADEVFLTNAINGIRWVRQFRDKLYTNIKTTEIYNRFIKTIHT